MGYCNREYLPTRRGFQTFSGFYLGSQDYYRHTRVPNMGSRKPGYDFRRQDKVDREASGNYSAVSDKKEEHSGYPMEHLESISCLHNPSRTISLWF